MIEEMIEELPEGWDQHVMATALATVYTVELTGSGPYLTEYARDRPIKVKRFDVDKWYIEVDYHYSRQSSGVLIPIPQNSDIDEEWIEQNTFALDVAITKANEHAIEKYPAYVAGINAWERRLAERS